MKRLTASSLSLGGRVNPLAPAAVAVTGLILIAAGNRWVGGGVAIGAVLALANALVLTARVDLAASVRDVGSALLIMQIGLLVTFGIIAVTTLILIHISLALTVACAAGFLVAHLLILAEFYWSHARRAPTVSAVSSSERNRP
ncbi:MAG TPA: hypothetical protein VF221_14445 [Chloroflexota bacterium]